MIYEINTDQCTFCGTCVEDCSPGVISLDRENRTAVIDNERCIECSHCAMVCPVNAVRVDGEKLEEYPEEATSLEHLIRSKRSVRSYRAEPIDSADLEAIMTAGRTTATATNSMQVEAILLQGEEVAAASRLVAGVLMKAIGFGLNPAGRLILKLAGLKKYADEELLGNYKTRVADTLAGKDDAFFFKAPAVAVLTYPRSSNGKRFGRTDCALAGENMMLTAHARGIGSCMIGFAEAALFTKGLRAKIGVPADRRIGLIFTLGYRKTKYYRYPARKKW